MKRGVVTILTFILFVVQTNSQPLAFLSTQVWQSTFNSSSNSSITNNAFFLSAENFSSSELSSYRSELNEFVQKMARKQGKIKDQKYFLEQLFYKVHNKFLKNYKNLVTFEELFENGYYDCVSGTALYVLILDELGFDYSIYESDFHVMVMVHYGKDKVLFESTDFSNGFVDDNEEINRRIEYYQTQNSEKNDAYYNYKLNTSRIIDSKQLAGLLFYNLAVREYNNQNFTEAIAFLDKAEVLYQGSRVKELRNLISNMTLSANSTSLD